MNIDEAKRFIIKEALVMSDKQGNTLLDGDTVMKCIDKIYTELDDLSGTDTTTKLTRVEVISKEGRVFGSWLKNGNFYEVSIQDEGRTIKLFEIDSNNNTNNNSLVRKNNHGFDHPSESPKTGGLTNG